MSQKELPNGLPAIRRYITDHNEQGRAIFSEHLPEVLDWNPVGVAKFALGYTTNQYPVDFSGKQDVSSYGGYLKHAPGITIPGGTVLRIVDMAPGATSPMHRTVSLDYGVVLEGEVDLVLDSGEVRPMMRGDISIQRGTNHAWRNRSETKPARMLYVLQESKPFEVAGKTLGEDYGIGMDGVRPSGLASNEH